uniref:Carboxypeptidase regulatory-like domain-containing protein n=1 Tax=Candidatus Methanophagaceae archaeon ANME-1 ERB6 TaxID=2759912 RepID=A0A7G9YSQ4_9EURY|nr:hypothetical protein EDLMLJLI_00031 [Methanosarcinales archaeon ANME-1 ERB6]
MIKMDFLERYTTRLSFAVVLLDDYSRGKPIGRVDVSLKKRKRKPIKNLSSYYLFLDLPDGTYTVQVRSDYYFDEDSGAINPVELDPKNPVVNITLKPNPSYPFPPGATLIRGKVCDSAGKAVSGAKVKAKGWDVENKTRERGEFVLYFEPLTEDEIITEGGKRFVKGDGDKIIHLEVDGVTEPIELEAEEGKTTSVIIK